MGQYAAADHHEVSFMLTGGSRYNRGDVTGFDANSKICASLLLKSADRLTRGVLQKSFEIAVKIFLHQGPRRRRNCVHQVNHGAMSRRDLRGVTDQAESVGSG